MMRIHTLVFLLLGCLLATEPAQALELAVRDAITGAPVKATLSFEAGTTQRRVQLDGQLRRLDEITLRTDAWVYAEGYQSLPITLAPDDLDTTVLLDPVQQPPAFQRLAERIQHDPSARWLQGWVRRSQGAQPLAGAVIAYEGRTTRSNAEGYFELELEPASTGAVKRSSLHVQADGTGEQYRDGMLVPAGIQHLLLVLGPGIPARATETIGAMDRGDRALVTASDEPLDLPLLPRPQTPAGPLLAPALTPPASIRVGFADAACTQTCCTSQCTHTCAYSLETYVQRGLNDEWIASWNTQSLRAGSIAYRSYGAWRVANQISDNFDICSNACCQVNDPDTSSSTTAAVARTPGIMLTRNESGAFSAEYSAQNNSWDDPNDGLNCSNSDLSCGNGHVGSPSTNWPCLADPVATGKGCFGHGRGMSQWGTKYWGDSPEFKSWTWMVDHYFNANGAGSGLRTAVMTSPVTLSNLSPQPTSAHPGDSLQISATATNLASAPHDHLLIGASLYRSGVGYLDDPGNDTPVSLTSGSQTIQRTFAIPALAPQGSYDLLLSLYLDVDENGIISAKDLALALARVNDAVQILGALGADIFEDDFEVKPY